MVIKSLVVALLLAVFCISNAYAKCHSLTVSGANNWFPISYKDEKGQLNGVAIRILHEIADQMNLKIETDIQRTWTEVIIALENNEIDIIVGAYYNDERAAKFTYSNAFFQNRARVFVKKDKKFQINKLEDLIGRKGARPKGGSFGQRFDDFDRAHLRMLQVPASNDIPLTKWLLNDSVDFIIADQLDGRLSIKKQRIEKDIVALPYNISENEVHYIMSKKSPCSARIKAINLHIQKMHVNGRIKQIVEEELGELIKPS